MSIQDYLLAFWLIPVCIVAGFTIGTPHNIESIIVGLKIGALFAAFAHASYIISLIL